MRYRERYKKATGLKLKRSIHIHHLDGNHSNHVITNLLHITQKKHMQYHSIISGVNATIYNCKNQGYELKDLETDTWLRSSCNPIYTINTWKKTDMINNYFKSQLEKRNKILGIENDYEFFTKEQLYVINIYK